MHMQLVFDFDAVLASLIAARIERERAAAITAARKAEREAERRRFRVVWPPQSPYGDLDLPKVESDPFAEQLFARGPFPATEEASELVKPTCRSECARIPRPCPFVSCRFNLYLDVREDGVLRLNFPDKEPDEVTASCALDLAEDGSRTLEQVAALMGMSKERARQIEGKSLAKLREALPKSPAFQDDDYDVDSWV